MPEHDYDSQSLMTGDITTFDFSIYKYKRPNNYFQSRSEEKLIKKYLKSEKKESKDQKDIEKKIEDLVQVHHNGKIYQGPKKHDKQKEAMNALEARTQQVIQKTIEQNEQNQKQFMSQMKPISELLKEQQERNSLMQNLKEIQAPPQSEVKQALVVQKVSPKPETKPPVQVVSAPKQVIQQPEGVQFSPKPIQSSQSAIPKPAVVQQSPVQQVEVVREDAPVQEPEQTEVQGGTAANEQVKQESFYTLEAPTAPVAPQVVQAPVEPPAPAVKKISPQMLLAHKKKKPLVVLPKKKPLVVLPKKKASIQELMAKAIKHAKQS